MIKKIFSFLALIILGACTNAKFAAVNVTALTYDGEIISDIAYGDEERQKLDIYLPEIQGGESLPVIVFFHGGRWTDGAKDQYKFVGVTLSKLGYIVVLPNTRLYPDVKHPIFVKDGARAVAWVHDNIATYGGNKNLFLSGHSSGAHIASLIAADDDYLKPYDLSSSAINAFAGLSGPYDFVPEATNLKDMFGPPSQYPTMQATTCIDGTEPPMLLIYGQKDKAVWARNHELLAKAINENGGDVTVKLYPDANHVDTVSALSWINPAKLTVASDMDDFFRKNLD